MSVTLRNVKKCISVLESGKDYQFVLEANGNLRPYIDMDDDHENIVVVLTPEWYDLSFCSNGWDEEVLKNELNDFEIAMKKLDDEFISTKFTVIWR